MRRSILARAVAGALGVAASATVPAQSDAPAVVVTGTPLGSGLFEMVSPADVLTGRELMFQRRGSIGETLDRMPGVSSSSFGPAVARPVIRGLDGDRIRILQNGTGLLDASSLSFDHAVPYDALIAERVEIVRGPAAVLYGGNAVGGVVNLLDNRIPQSPISGFTGRMEPRFGGAEGERSFGAVLEAGNGQFAVHADAFQRNTGDLRIPGWSRSDRQRAIDGAGVDQPRGRVPNSDIRSEGGAIGASVTLGRGYFGLSHGTYDSNYGSIAERDVRIDMKSSRTDLAGELRDLGSIITGVKFKLGRTDYQHRELDVAAGTTNTTFGNKGTDSRLEFTHGAIGPMKGAFGMSTTDFDFSALGAEAFVPQTGTRARGFFLYEEAQLGAWKLSAGLRNERTRVRSQGGGPIDPDLLVPRFDPERSRSFRSNSSSFGALYSVSKSLGVAANVAFTQRAPTYYELFANGPHAATGAYEVGNTAFNVERSRSMDLGLRWRSGKHSASFSAYRTTFRNFITLATTGAQRGADGGRTITDADGDQVDDVSGEDILPELQYVQVPALFRGFEASGRARIYEGVGALDLVAKGDYVRASDRSTGQPLPRIPPLRLSLGLEYGWNRLTAGVEMLRASGQSKVAANELPTDGYTLVNLNLAYGLVQRPFALQAFARLTNLFDKEARNHVSFFKDVAPLGGRALMVGMRASY